jgi:hypothetical protein
MYMQIQGGKVKKRIKIGGLYITNKMRRAVKRSLLRREEQDDHKEEVKSKKEAREERARLESEANGRLLEEASGELTVRLVDGSGGAGERRVTSRELAEAQEEW